jgi:DNA topoisomerase IB
MTATAEPGTDRAGLRFVHDFEPGFGRVRSGAGFVYLDDHGSAINDPEVLERVRALGIPPAWTMVWIAPRSDAHLQATGMDRRGRKQYVYHPDWRHERDELKFRDMEAFARAQPRLRRQIEAALASADEPLGHLRVLSLSLRLLDIGLLRVGSDRYARDNKHYGLTTLLREQVTVRPDRAIFDYVGKSGRRQRLAVADVPALQVLGALKRRRGGPPELLVFRAQHGWSRIHREDVNNFLRREARGPFSAKEYRTWNGTVIAAATLAAQRPRPSSGTAVASRAVAAVLGNTPTVARHSYIDPRVLARFGDGLAISLDGLPADAWRARELIERRVLALLADNG